MKLFVDKEEQLVFVKFDQYPDVLIALGTYEKQLNRVNFFQDSLIGQFAGALKKKNEDKTLLVKKHYLRTNLYDLSKSAAEMFAPYLILINNNNFTLLSTNKELAQLASKELPQAIHDTLRSEIYKNDLLMLETNLKNTIKDCKFILSLERTLINQGGKLPENNEESWFPVERPNPS